MQAIFWEEYLVTKRVEAAETEKHRGVNLESVRPDRVAHKSKYGKVSGYSPVT